MTRKVTCSDHAVMESFFGILKQEIYYGEALVSYDALQSSISDTMMDFMGYTIKIKMFSRFTFTL